MQIVLIGNNLAITALWLFSAAAGARSDTDNGSPPFTLVASFNGTAPPLEGILNQPRPTFAVKIIIVMSPTHIILQALSLTSSVFVTNDNTCQPSLLPGSRWWYGGGLRPFFPSLLIQRQRQQTACTCTWQNSPGHQCNRIRTRSFPFIQ